MGNNKTAKTVSGGIDKSDVSKIPKKSLSKRNETSLSKKRSNSMLGIEQIRAEEQSIIEKSQNKKRIKKSSKKKSSKKKSSNIAADILTMQDPDVSSDGISVVNETIMFFCAHNDDNIVGAGGTIAKYSKEGKDVVTVIFSYGEMSHPHLQEKVIINMRVKESKRAQNILDEKRIIYLGLKEGNFEKGINEMKSKDVIEKLIIENSPSKIFVHSIDDMHPDHSAVYSIVNEVLERIDFRGEVYSYDVWTILNLRRRDSPKLVVDISDTFKNKIQAFKAHRSQVNARLLLTWSIYLKAFLNGINNGVKYAEVFYKLR